MLWRDIEQAEPVKDTSTRGSFNASLYVPLTLEAGESKTIHLMMSWYVPHSDLRHGGIPAVEGEPACDPSSGCCSPEYTSQFYEPWYSQKFSDIEEISKYQSSNFRELREQSELFSRYIFELRPAPRSSGSSFSQSEYFKITHGTKAKKRFLMGL